MNMPGQTCFFCDRDDPKKHKIITESENFYARWDNFPVSKGHAEVVPKRHIVSFFNLRPEEVLELYRVVKVTKDVIDALHGPDGYNLGVNEGEAAGRTVHHFHFHLIPRCVGDVPNPRGGIRNIIPEKGDYKESGQ